VTLISLSISIKQSKERTKNPERRKTKLKIIVRQINWSKTLMYSAFFHIFCKDGNAEQGNTPFRYLITQLTKEFSLSKNVGTVEQKPLLVLSVRKAAPYLIR
jgi:hypothetical protein